jgi:hypothetical protein
MATSQEGLSAMKLVMIHRPTYHIKKIYYYEWVVGGSKFRSNLNNTNFFFSLSWNSGHHDKNEVQTINLFLNVAYVTGQNKPDFFIQQFLVVE